MRQSVDAQVTAELRRADGSLTAADVAARCGMSALAATHRLQRMVRDGSVQVTAETVQTGGRVSEIVLHYQIQPRKTLGLPSWLDPRRLPESVASIRRHTLPMPGWSRADECEAV